MLTIMGIRARTANLDIIGTTATITKIMAEKPRRVAEIVIEIEIPDKGLSEKEKATLENAAIHCPVAKSLSEQLKQSISFSYSQA